MIKTALTELFDIFNYKREWNTFILDCKKSGYEAIPSAIITDDILATWASQSISIIKKND